MFVYTQISRKRACVQHRPTFVSRTPTIATIAALVCALLLALGGAAVTSAPAASAATVVARVGSHGWTVVVVQRVIGVTADGVYGPKTAGAVAAWQRARRLPATGVVDSATWSRIWAVWVRMPATGRDVSWPQCPKGVGRGYGLPMPPTSAQLVVIGLTSGPGFSPNPCLAAQTGWAKTHHVYTAAYAMTTFPTGLQFAAYRFSGPYRATTLTGQLNNVGFREARFNVASMRRVGLATPIVWIDVEPYTPGWNTKRAANKAVINGAVLGYRSAGYRVGFYSIPQMWSKILGTARYGLPEWRTAGARGQGVANTRCAKSYSFQGGAAVLSQWWGPSIDYDTTCPSVNTPGLLATYFHKY